MSGEYPTEEELQRIRDWPNDDLRGLLGYVKSVGNYWPDETFGWMEEEATNEVTGRAVRRYHISTGGWSGNEDILEALQEHRIFWMMYWQQTRRGGHFTFEAPHD